DLQAHACDRNQGIKCCPRALGAVPIEEWYRNYLRSRTNLCAGRRVLRPCYTEVVEESGQCGGLGWDVICVNGTTCTRQNKGWATCESTAKVTYPAAEWQQCDLQDNDNVCADGLICIDDNDYHGMCIKEVAELWGQCGGSGWVTDCDIGSRCEAKTVTYSQCVPNDSQSEKSASVGGSPEAGLAVFLDVSSLLKPIAQLKELAATVKDFPCSMRKFVFPETNCYDDKEQEHAM
ncbi:LOW QUALITY PROTEIN: Hypothetical protein PHPALM_16725, partial [Phytophthora palmivora]